MVAVAQTRRGSSEPGELDAQVRRLHDCAPAYARLPLSERRALLRDMRYRTADLAEEWVRVACEAKGLDLQSPLSGEEWLAGPFITTRAFRLLDLALEDVARYGQPRIDDDWIREREGGALAVRVFPAGPMDAALFNGITAETYVQPGVTRAQLRERQAAFYKKPDHSGKVSLILGAGNVSSIPPTDVASKLFVEGKVCVLKMNPVNDYLGPIFERIFAHAIAHGWIAIAYGGADVGRYLVEHAGVDEIHITGSDKTHDAMVWGPPGPDREARRARNEPLLKKEVTSELGNVSPVIIVPGAYGTPELEFQTKNIAGAVTNNGSFNCNAAKLLVNAKGWGQREDFVGGIERQLAEAPVRRAYYPGAEDRWHHFVEGRANVRQIGHAGPGELPWTVIRDVDPTRSDDPVFSEEPFCSVLSETAIGSEDPEEFLFQAVRFVNERVWGTLNATIIIHPKTAEQHRGALERAIEDLRYGAVGVNLWPATIFALGTTPWGGYPGAPLTDIQSGRGFVHNSYMIEDIDKCVARGPVVGGPLDPKPLWFPGHRTANLVGRNLVKLERDGSWIRLPAVAAAAMRA